MFLSINIYLGYKIKNELIIFPIFISAVGVIISIILCLSFFAQYGIGQLEYFTIEHNKLCQSANELNYAMKNSPNSYFAFSIKKEIDDYNTKIDNYHKIENNWYFGSIVKNLPTNIQPMPIDKDISCY